MTPTLTPAAEPEAGEFTFDDLDAALSELVRAHANQLAAERERCAQICDALAAEQEQLVRDAEDCDVTFGDQHLCAVRGRAFREAARAVRAGGAP